MTTIDLTTSQLLVADSFEDARPAGGVIGRKGPDGTLRKGIDCEGVIGIDNGALRIQPLVQPGWGRAGIAYGPFPRENGLAFAAFVLNGHNTSQTGPILQSVPRRLARWALGSETESLARRMLAWSRNGHKRILARQLRRWMALNRRYGRADASAIDENLAIGFFPQEAPQDPVHTGSGFIVHASGAENGELWARAGSDVLPAIRSLQNVPIYYLVVLREQGAAYYAASLPGVPGTATYPLLRPVAIDPFGRDELVYAGLHQSVLGQIGFRVDTRVYGAQVARIAGLDQWYGTAHAADHLTSDGVPLDGSVAETGGRWVAHSGYYIQTARGAKPLSGNNLAVLDSGRLTGLLHVMLHTGLHPTSGSVIWRFQDDRNYWRVYLSGECCWLLLHWHGRTYDMAVEQVGLRPNAQNSVQIVDDGDTFGVYLNGRLLFDTWFHDLHLSQATGVGLANDELPHGELTFSHLEAHPRTLPLPGVFDLPQPWLPQAGEAVVTDYFEAPTGELSNHTTRTGQSWTRQMGDGRIVLTGEGSAQVDANIASPNPNRTLYTLPWEHPDFADLKVTITPPGSARGQGERGRGGLVFWQDSSNYIIVNTWLDDYYDGTSVSSFFHLAGFEDIYDAVWTNVGRRITWGEPYALRVAFDGMYFSAYVNAEPVLYRALTDVYPAAACLRIQRVGIAVNWEWGHDTGSVFHNFVARRRRSIS